MGVYMLIKNSLKSIFLIIILSHSVTLPKLGFLPKLGLGSTATIAGLFCCHKTILASKEKKLHQFSEDASTADPEVYEVFQKIKKGLNIHEDVKLRLWHKEKLKEIAEFASVEGEYSDYSQTVYLGCTDFLPGSTIIHNIAHELEHHKQVNKYPGSKAYSYRNLRANEQAADAAAAGYQYCFKCLRDLAKAKNTDHQYLPHEDDDGVFTTKKGYFCSEDYELYAKEAENNNALCYAHQNNISNDAKLEDFLPIEINKE